MWACQRCTERVGIRHAISSSPVQRRWCGHINLPAKDWLKFGRGQGRGAFAFTAWSCSGIGDHATLCPPKGNVRTAHFHDRHSGSGRTSSVESVGA